MGVAQECEMADMPDDSNAWEGFKKVSPDHDFLTRVTHALLLALPPRIEVDADTYVRVIRQDDPVGCCDAGQGEPACVAGDGA